MAQSAAILKAKTVRRTITVLEYFALKSPQATVMDLVRSLDIPQSSMSELLSALVDSGVLVRDATARNYTVTPRMASLGLAAQPQAIADGSLFRLMDELADETGLTIGLFGICGMDAQAHRLSEPSDREADRGEPDLCECLRDGRFGTGKRPLRDLQLGVRTRLSSSVIGHVLLAALGPDNYDRLLWRLLAECPSDQKFDYAQACGLVREIEAGAAGSGPSGIVKGWSAAAVLLPEGFGTHPLALAAFYPNSAVMQVSALTDVMKHRLSRVAIPQGGKISPVHQGVAA